MTALTVIEGGAGSLSNISAEGALLGVLLWDGGTIIDRAADLVQPADFFEPLHGRIFDRIVAEHAHGRPVSPVALKPYFEADEAMRELGGAAYMARLTRDAHDIIAPDDTAERYAVQVADLAARRRTMARLADPDQSLATIAGDLATSAAAGFQAQRTDIATLDWTALADVQPSPKAFIIPRLAPAGEVTLFTGPGSAGKSLLAQQLATALAAGAPTLGIEMGRASAIYLTCEDDAEQLHFRQVAICRSLGVSMANLTGKLHIASLRGQMDNALCIIDANGRFALAPLYHRVARLIRTTGARLVALDNVAHLFTGNENDRSEVTQFVNALNRLAGETGAAILLLGHPNKSGDTYSGSTAWLNAVRSQVFLEHDIETDMRTMTVGKANYAPKGEAVRFAWVDWAFVREADLPADTARALGETTKANGENAAFLRCLATCTEQKRNVSHQHGSNHAPKVFAGMTEAKGIKQQGFAAAMERLLHLGQIELDAELWAGSNRHPKRGIRLSRGGQ